MDSKNKILATFGIVFLIFGFSLVSFARGQGKLRLIFCDVGQGDGILVITPEGQQVLVDGGPGSAIVDCLSRAMPFWDRSIDVMVSTHPQQDHMEGLVEVLGRYEVGRILATGVSQKSELFQAWQKAEQKEKENGARVYVASQGERLVAGGATFEILWPTKDKISEWKVLAPSDLNETGVVVRIAERGFCAYLTADVPKEVLSEVLDRPCQILKVSHHGSKTGTDEEVLLKVKPKLAVIQVGKRNRYGHPNAEVLELLQKDKIKILRNDLSGMVEVDFDGKAYRVFQERL